MGAMLMTDRILLDIAETEAEAVEMERRAGQEARELVLEAKQVARHLFETGLETDERQFSDAMSMIRTNADTLLSKRLCESSLEVEAMGAQACEQFDKAVSVIVEGIVGEYGHH